MKEYVKIVCLAFGIAAVAAFAGVDSSVGCPEGTVISSIQYEGLEHTKKRVVDRELLNKAGETFSAEKFELEKRRVSRLGVMAEL